MQNCSVWGHVITFPGNEACRIVQKYEGVINDTENTVVTPLTMFEIDQSTDIRSARVVRRSLL